MTDEQRAREWLLPLLQDMVAKVLSDHTVLKEQQQIIEQTAALLASRALEARQEALESVLGDAAAMDLSNLRNLLADVRNKALEEAATLVNRRKTTLDRVYRIEEWNQLWNQLQWTEDAIRSLAAAGKEIKGNLK